jgi:hypothetical protein
MKIGLLTYHWVYNFGANLQVYSTVGYLRNNGFDPVVINWVPADMDNRYNSTVPEEQILTHRKFIEEILPCSELCRTAQDIAEVIRKLDIKKVIIGSDIVLQHTPFLSRLRLTKKGIALSKKLGSDAMFPNPFWGNFISLLTEKIPVVVMSASSQNTNYKLIRGSLRRKMNAALQGFESVTVRDEWTKGMVEYLSFYKLKPLVTPDPVFAYNQNIPAQLSEDDIRNKFRISGKYILVSFRSRKHVTKEWLTSLNVLAQKNNIRCIALTMPNGIKFDHPFEDSVGLPLSPEEWYGLIKYSCGYIGENMHPVVIALHNSVPFFAFDSYGIVKYKYFVNEESSKIFDILSKAGFLDNRISILGRGYKCPAPGEVFRKITDFEIEKCRRFGILQQERYNMMMKNMTGQ